MRNLSDATLPSELWPEELKGVELPEFLFKMRHGNPFELAAAVINDDETISDEQREEQLRALFRTVGKEIVFTGPKPKNWARIPNCD